MQRLQAPAIFLQPRCQVIEQFRVRGGFAVHAEIAGRPDDAVAKVIMPDAIGQHARGECVAFVHDPACQRQTPLTLGLRFVFDHEARQQIAQRGRAGGVNHRAPVRGIATSMQVLGTRGRFEHAGERHWKLR